MKRKPLIVPVLLLFMMSVAGCSVKEIRSVCPCRLMLDFSGNDTSVIRHAALSVTADDGFLYRDTVEKRDFVSEYMLEVPQDVIRVRAWSGDEGMMGENGLVIPDGEDCPPVYMHASVTDLHCEKHVERILLRKNFCSMTIVLTEEYFPYMLKVAGNVCGYDKDGKPVGGEFECVVEHQDGRGCVRIPRQISDDLMLLVGDDDTVYKAFSLGEYVEVIGYDWSAEDLEDMTVYMDYAQSRIVIEVEKWDKEYVFDIRV